MVNYCIVVLAIISAVAWAECKRYTVEVSSLEELSKALENARPGASISLAPGTYSGALTVSAKADPSDPSCSIIIDGHDKATFMSRDKWVIRFDEASGILLTGIEITKASDYGIFIVESQSVNISRCKFSNIDHVGVMVMGGKWNSVDSCHFSYVKENPVWIGFEIESVQNKVENCYFEDGLGGEVLLLDNAARNTTVTHNVFGGTHSAFYRWIHVVGVGNNVTDNTFKEDTNNLDFSDGVFTEGSDNYFKKNSMKMSGSYKYGFLNEGTREVICASNVVYGGAQFTNGPVDKNC